jgi:YebC/PmpR family DNA-binding regulatory protein
MAGHSQFKNIMYRKGAQDAKRAKMFAKISREIIVAAKSGIPDPHTNPRLRSAIAAARSINMPKDNIDRALKKALGAGDGDNFEEIRYEGYGTNGVAVIVECLTDNRNRTASEVRSILTKAGGNLGESGSVSFSFQKLGIIIYLKEKIKFDEIFEYAVENGADNVEDCEEHFEITCPMDYFANLRDSLYKQFGEPEEAKLIWHPINTIECDDHQKQTIQKMIDSLEDSDDVQNVYTNMA